MLIGYARVSTQEQETHLQLDALKRYGCEIIYEEKKSGGNMRRPVLEKILFKIKPGDTVVVYKLDRVARSLKDLLTIIDRLHSAGADFTSLTEVIDTRSPAGRMMLQILGAFAEFERAMIQERTRSGMAAAMKRGVKLGRPRGMTAEEEAEAMRIWYGGLHTKTAIAKQFNVHISSVKRAIRRDQENRQKQLTLE
ncbi:recombinase family protein [Herbaspirillum rubrisubalbicans]|uniref:Resolvase n=1 Tax=Herbaspirillum rubrisubalbicans TaxID=80842 RepID=A0ABX9C6I1_9BURK|nr:recombinase family protein [Herbaspirillum rubrisubalbicans]RAM66158.1 resolvase [Herbaspirillum rubrisubalbicans]